MQEHRRTIQELNDLGFRALVEALGRDDALRFIRQFQSPAAQHDERTSEPSDDHLPPMTVEQAHERILDIQGQQGNLL